MGRQHVATGRPVLTAAAAGQFVHEGVIAGTGERRGVFTWALLDALKNGDTNGDGYIQLSELVTHVQNMVPQTETAPYSDAHPARGRLHVMFRERYGKS